MSPRGEQKPPTKLLSCQDLHKYLIQKIADTNAGNCPKVSDIGVFTSLENILDNLKSGYEALQKKMLSHYLIPLTMETGSMLPLNYTA